MILPAVPLVLVVLTPAVALIPGTTLPALSTMVPIVGVIAALIAIPTSCVVPVRMVVS